MLNALKKSQRLTLDILLLGAYKHVQILIVDIFMLNTFANSQSLYILVLIYFDRKWNTKYSGSNHISYSESSF